MSRTIPYSHTRDVQRVAEYDDAKRDYTDPDVDCRVSANVGNLMAVALAAAGAYALRLGGSTACETDYLAASGATFPADVPLDELVAFNNATLRPDMDECLEMRRYSAIANFFKRRKTA